MLNFALYSQITTTLPDVLNVSSDGIDVAGHYLVESDLTTAFISLPLSQDGTKKNFAFD